MDVRYDHLSTGILLPTPVEIQPGVSFVITEHLRCADIKLTIDSCDLFATIGSLLCTAHTSIRIAAQFLPDQKPHHCYLSHRLRSRMKQMALDGSSLRLRSSHSDTLVALRWRSGCQPWPTKMPHYKYPVHICQGQKKARHVPRSQASKPQTRQQGYLIEQNSNLIRFSAQEAMHKKTTLKSHKTRKRLVIIEL